MRKNFAFQWLSVALAAAVTLSLSCTAIHSVIPTTLPPETSLQAARSRHNASAQKEKPAERFPETLHDYLRYALEHSANLRDSFAAYQAALRKRPQVTVLPDPRLSYGYFIRSVETRVGPQRHRLGLAQSFPWFGTLALRGEEADLEARAELYRFLTLKNTLVFDIGKTYAELAYLYAAVRITEETMQLVQSWEEVLQVRFSSGIGSHSDLVRVQVELGQLEDRIAEFQDLIRPTQVAFNALLNRAAGAPITLKTDILIETAFNREATAASKLTADTLNVGNPELAMLDTLIAARRAGIQLAEKKYYPDFTLGIDYIATDDRPGRQANGKDAVLPTLSLNIPLYWEKNRAAVEEAQLRQRSVEERRKDREYMLTADFARAKFDLRDAERKIALFTHTLIPKAEESIEASYTAYESGQAGFLDVLDSERRLLDFELSLSRAQTDRAIATTQLFMLSGAYTDFLFSEEGK